MENSDVGEKLLAEEDAMKELAEAAPADADEAPQIAGIAFVEVDMLEAPAGSGVPRAVCGCHGDRDPRRH